MTVLVPSARRIFTKPAPKMVTIIGSTTVRANIVAIAASTALPPFTSISVPASEARGWLEVTIPFEATVGCLIVGRVRPLMVLMAAVVRPREWRGNEQAAGEGF